MKNIRQNGLFSKLTALFFILLTLPNLSLQAAGKPLIVAVDNFSPPFVSRGAHQQIYGFDISMMDALCKILNRSCVYRPMSFSKLFNQVIQKQADVAVGAITITTERAQQVNFTIPYLVSKSLFIGNKIDNAPPFVLADLNNQAIGVEKGTIYPQLLASMGIINPTIVLFDQPEDIMEGLGTKKINYALMDAPAAMYWQSQGENLQLFGKSFEYGFGLAIAVDKNNLALLAELNKSLLLYQDSKQFNDDYAHYLNYF